jgi:hypothetical protein
LSVRYRVQGWRGAREDGRLNTYEHVAEYFEYLIRGILDIINNPSTATDLDADVRRRKALELLPSILEQYHKFLQLYLERTHRFPQVPDDIRKPLQEWERQHSPDPDADPSELPNPNISEYSPGSESEVSWRFSSPGGGGLNPSSEPDTTETVRPISLEALNEMLRMLMDRLREPVRLELRLLDDRVIARRLDGNRAVSVDLSRGYRMVGYISV